MKKNIVIIGINFYPEDTAIGIYSTQLAQYFQKIGRDVTVLTGFPYYPAWKINSEYRNKKSFLKEDYNGIKIIRYKQYVPLKPTFFKRILHLMDFTIGSFINIFKIKKADIVICIVPFIGSILIGKILARMKKAKLWVHIQDFEFDAAFESNIKEKKSNNSLIVSILFWIEKKLLLQADFLSTISAAMLNKLNNKIKNNKKRKLLPNWVDITQINPINAKRHEYLKSNKFKILYSGNIGEKQDWSFFLAFAKQLEKFDDVEIILVGNGGKKEWVVNKLSDSKNVKHYFPVDYSDLSSLLCSADLHILFQKEGVIDTVMPSKILAMMASEKPSLITGSLKSEVYSIIDDSQGGVYFKANDIKNSISFVLKLKDNDELCKKLGLKSRAYAINNFSKQNVLIQFKEVLDHLTKK